MSENKEPRNNPPTPKMIAAATSAATRHGVALPDNYDKDFDTCKAFLDKYLSIPSPKALSFAEKIAKDKNLELPPEVRESAKALSEWIDNNKS